MVRDAAADPGHVCGLARAEGDSTDKGGRIIEESSREKEGLCSASGLDRRLARIEGQVQGIRRMVAANEYCMDVLTQIAAARSALEKVAIEVSLNHLQHCVIHRDEHAHPKSQERSEEELLEELRTLFKRLYG